MYRLAVLIAIVIVTSIAPHLGAQVLATGQATIQPSDGPNHPNFRTPVTRQHTLPVNLGSTVGAELILSLRDVSRPGQTCPPTMTPEVLQAGCVAVDWPFFSARAINLIAFDTTAGSVVRHLHIDGTMSPVSEPDNN